MATIYTSAVNAYVTVKAGSPTSGVNIYQSDGLELTTGTQMYTATVRYVMDTVADNTLFVKISTPDGQYRIYKLRLLRNSSNTDLEIVRAARHENASNGSLGTAVDGLPKDESSYGIQLPRGAARTWLYLQTADPNATIRVLDEGTGEYGPAYTHSYSTGESGIEVYNKSEKPVYVRVTAPNGVYKDYVIYLYNVPTDATLSEVEVGYLDRVNNQLKSAAITGQRSYAASITILAGSNTSGTYETEDYLFVPFRLVASDANATIQMRDVQGGSYLQYSYNNSGTLTYELDRAPGTGDPIPVNGVTVVMNSAIRNSNVLSGELVIDKRTYSMFQLEVTVTAVSGNTQTYDLFIYCNKVNYDDLAVEVNDEIMTMASDGRFHYVKNIAPGDIQDGDILYYMGNGSSADEVAGRLYRLYPTDVDYLDKLANRAIYREQVFAVSQREAKLAAYYADLANRLNSDTMTITIGTGDNAVTTSPAYTAGNANNPDGSIRKTVNPKVALSGAETVVPIRVNVGSSTQTFQAVILKTSLDQNLDYIKVEDQSLDLNRNAEGEMVARATVYNTDRRAKIEIGAAKTTSRIELAHYDFFIYNKVDGEWVKGDLQDVWNFDPQYGVLTVNAGSLNDGDNLFRFVVTPVSGDVGPSEYKLIINYVNVDLYLDQVNPGKGIDGLTIYAGTDPDTDMVAANVLSLSPTYYQKHLDYTFDFSSTGGAVGGVIVDASAYDSTNTLQSQRLQYQEDRLKEERYSFWYNYWKAFNPNLDQSGIQTAITSVVIPAGTVIPGDTLAGTSHTSQNEIDAYVAANLPLAMAQEVVMVQVGGGTAEESERIEAITITDPSVDYAEIPITLTVPFTGYTRTYYAVYHNLSNDATIAKDGEGNFQMGVVGYEPTLRGDTTYTYEVSYATNVVDVYAIANHIHDHSGTQITLVRVASDGSTQVMGTEISQITRTVQLNLGINTFQFVVQAEQGNQLTYTLYIYRSGADLSLDWLRVDGRNTTLLSDGTYLAYVPEGTDLHTVTAKAKDPSGIVELLANVGAAAGTSPSAGAVATMPGVSVDTATVGDAYQSESGSWIIPATAEVTVTASDTIHVQGVLSQPDYTTTETTGQGNVDGPRITTTRVYHQEESNLYSVTTTVVSWARYTLNILPVNRDALTVYMDTGAGTFEQNSNVYTALWNPNELKADGSGELGAFVVGVPESAVKGKVRVYTSLTNGGTEEQQMVQFGALVPQYHDPG